MRVGIVTFHAVLNYGAVLQTYALAKTIESLGHEVYVIDYRPLYFYWRDWTIISKDMRYNINRLFQFFEFYRFRKNIKLTNRTYWTDASIKKDPPIMDCYICGSDQIWSLGITRRLDDIYFNGFGLDYAKKISYAASLGGVPFPDECKPRIKELLNRLDAVSVRDHFSSEQVKSLTGRAPEVVVDPTLLVDDYSNIIDQRDLPQKYIVAFSVQRSNYFMRTAIAAKKITGLPIINISPIFYKEMDIHHYRIGPGDWLAYIQNAEMVITNSYHGTILSAHFNRPCCVVLLQNINDPRNDRLTDFLKSIGLQHQLVKNYRDITKIANREINFEHINSKLDIKRKTSLKFITNNLT